MGDSVIGDTLCISESSDPKKCSLTFFWYKNTYLYGIVCQVCYSPIWQCVELTINQNMKYHSCFVRQTVFTFKHFKMRQYLTYAYYVNNYVIITLIVLIIITIKT